MQNDSRSHSQAIHVLKSHLNAAKISYEADASVDLVVKGANGDVPVLLVEGDTVVVNGICSVNINDIIAPQLNKVLESFHVLTEYAGYGRPTPVDRGASKSGRINYHEQFEDVVLRHNIFRRSPNPAATELAQYAPIIKRVVWSTMSRFRPVFSSMGMTDADLTSIATVHTISFIHNYAYGDSNQNAKLLSDFLLQRMAEVAKVTFRKARDCSCLPQSIKSTVTRHNLEGNDDTLSQILEFAEETTNPEADAEYEEGFYKLAVDGIVSRLEVVADGLLGIEVYVDGKLVAGSALESLGSLISSGAAVLTSEEEEGVDLSDSAIVAKRTEARRRLYEGLDELSAEKREWALAYASLSRDYAADARKLARHLCAELKCPRCGDRLQSGTSCGVCKIDGVPRYGIDYVGVRAQLDEAHDPLVAVMTAPIGEAEIRLNKRKVTEVEAPKTAAQKRQEVYDELPPNLTCPKAGCKKTNIKSAFTRSTDEDSSNLICPACSKSYHQYEFWAEQKRIECYAKLPEMVVCANPDCRKEKHKDEYGIRVPRLSKIDKKPLTACIISRCGPCRKPGSYGNR